MSSNSWAGINITLPAGQGLVEQLKNMRKAKTYADHLLEERSIPYIHVSYELLYPAPEQDRANTAEEWRRMLCFVMGNDGCPASLG